MTGGVGYLVQEGKADVDASDNKGRTSLHYACKRDNLKMVQFLLTRCNANVEAKDYKGMTALLTSIKYGSRETAQYLVGSGANVNATDSSGMTALHYACENCTLEAVKFLVKTGQAKVEAETILGRTTLHCARVHSEDSYRLTFVKFLVDEWQFNHLTLH